MSKTSRKVRDILQNAQKNSDNSQIAKIFSGFAKF